MEIKKGIIPCGGLGTRIWPWTKAMPKEMLPILNKPAIQYMIEEGLASDISNFMIITNRNKHAIADHFDCATGLESIKSRDKLDLIASTERISRLAHFTYIRQPEPLGLGHAVWMARHAIGKEYFGIFLPDDIIVSKQPALAQLIRIARQEKASVIAVQEVPTEAVSSYGIIAIKKQITPNLFQVSQLLEKPQPKDAPSNLAIIGRYVLSHKIFNSLETISNYTTDEIQLTDAIGDMLHNNERVFAYKISGTRYDIGSPVGWVKAIIGHALQDPHYSSEIRAYLNDMENGSPFLFTPAKNIEHMI